MEIRFLHKISPLKNFGMFFLFLNTECVSWSIPTMGRHFEVSNMEEWECYLRSQKEEQLSLGRKQKKKKKQKHMITFSHMCFVLFVSFSWRIRLCQVARPFFKYPPSHTQYRVKSLRTTSSESWRYEKA